MCEDKYIELSEMLIEQLSCQLPAARLSWADKVLLWNPCNPWVPAPKQHFVFDLFVGCITAVASSFFSRQ